jgi:hypothetical protein
MTNPNDLEHEQARRALGPVGTGCALAAIIAFVAIFAAIARFVVGP